MGFGTEIFFFVAFGLLVLGPKRLHTMLGHMRGQRPDSKRLTKFLNPSSPLSLTTNAWRADRQILLS